MFKIGDELCFDEKKIASYFNKFFTTVASSLVCKLPYADRIFTTDSYNFKNYYRSKGLIESMCKFSGTTEEYAFILIRKLEINKSTGVDCIPERFIKDGAPVLKGPVTHIINKSIYTNEVPQGFKEARVKPLYKKNNRQEVATDKSVSLT